MRPFPYPPTLPRPMTPMEANRPENVLILADDREAASLVPAALRQIPGVDLRFQRLSVGDYEVVHRCVFERKTVTDFAASIIDGRLFHQAARLARLELVTAIILEGRASQLAETGVRREALQGAMITLSLFFHLRVLRALDASETARLLVYAAHQLERHEAASQTRFGAKPKRKKRLQLHILQGLPGIGPSRAELLLQRFGSVQAVMCASLNSLQEVEGVGPKIASAIIDALKDGTGSYGNPPSPDLEI